MEQFKFYGYIYITINQQTKKCYVGQKSKSPEKSKNYLGSGTHFRNSVKKYGKQFFKKIILGEIFSNDLEDFKRQLNTCETECIYFFRTYGSDGKNYDEIYGYNMTINGGSKFGTKDNIETKNKKRKANKERYEDLEERIKSGLASHQRFIDNPNMYTIFKESALKYNKEHPEVIIKRCTSLKETNKKEGQKEKLSETQLKSYKNNPLRKDNLSKSLKNSWNKDLKRKENLSKRMKSLYENPEERKKCSIKMSKLYENPEEREKQRKSQLKSYKENPLRKEKQKIWYKSKREELYDPIEQYTKEGIFVKEYKNYKIAQYELNTSHIIDVLNNKRQSCKGYIWKYKK
jgi:hypothetical protein